MRDFSFLLEFMPWVLVALKIGLWAFSIVFLVNGLNELFIDLVKIYREIKRRVYIFGLKKNTPLTEDDLLKKSEQAVAVMIPCWDESAVIRRMLNNTLQVLRYSRYTIFVGVYPNDPDTQKEVDLISTEHENVIRVTCRENGPTSKADCLNWIIRGIENHEKRHAMTFDIVVMQDSEDILHPLTLKLFNFLIPRMDMVQLPVVPMEPRWWQFTRGTYLDEFAQTHSRDMVVRELLSSNLPSAGVGTAFSRRLLERLASGRQGCLFTVGSVTEDYDFGIRLAQWPRVKQVFSRVGFTRTRSKKNSVTGRERLITIKDYIVIREFFPHTFRAAVRQKSRWILGITLQSWRTIGWVGGFWTRYMLLRDRSGLLTNQVSMLANILVPVYLALQGYIFLFPNAYRFPPVTMPGELLTKLLLVNMVLLLWQVIVRVHYVQHLYGMNQAILTPLRLIWANVINYFATIRAIKIYVRHLITGAPIAWDKTNHSYPSEDELAGFRRRLGDLLLDSRSITIGQLETALERQKQTGRLLGQELAAMGVIEQTVIERIIADQHG
jgi:bacteriophage N4 adsorption protein B